VTLDNIKLEPVVDPLEGDGSDNGNSTEVEDGHEKRASKHIKQEVDEDGDDMMLSSEKFLELIDAEHGIKAPRKKGKFGARKAGMSGEGKKSRPHKCPFCSSSFSKVCIIYFICSLCCLACSCVCVCVTIVCICVPLCCIV
jgi:hypothetical protein